MYVLLSVQTAEFLFRWSCRNWDLCFLGDSAAKFAARVISVGCLLKIRQIALGIAMEVFRAFPA
jgi:hypothetical protein